MRAYKFLCDKYALENLRKQRVKQSRVSELNDPFELVPYDLTDPILRKTFLKTRDDVGRRKGFLCFSAGWSSPVLWAHYSDNHKGLCLGFEIPEPSGDPQDETDRVDYQDDPIPCPNFDLLTDAEWTSFVRKVLFTKFSHWRYEDEIRVWRSVKDPPSPLNFVDFCENLKLVEVIVGARSTVTKQAVIQALGPSAEKTVSRVRAGYDNFEMVKDENWG